MTLKDIAKHFNLSESTISRALNNHPKISQKTKEKIINFAKEHNFVKNSFATALATKKTNRIGIVFPENFYEFNKRDFFTQLEKYFILNSKKLNYDIYFIRTNSLKNILSATFVDGIIIANRNISKEDINLLEKKKLPFIFVAFKPTFLANNRKYIVFKSDNFFNGQKAAKLLYEAGCKKILTITSSNKKLTDYTDRTYGFLDFFKNIADIKVDVKSCSMTFDDGQNFIKSFSKNDFDGIFCQQDKVALGIISLAEQYNISIPKELKIIGHDNLDILNYFSPKLSTFSQNYSKITFNALTFLISKIDNTPVECSFYFKSHFIKRESF